MRFTDVCLLTEDVPRLCAFYEMVFGVKAQGDAIHSWLALPGLLLVIDSAKLLKENSAFWYASGQSVGNVIIGFNVADVDAEHERLAGLGVQMLGKPTTHPWGARSFQFRDVDGNIINFRTVLE